MKNWKDKIAYITEHILPKLEEAFKRGDKKYAGMQHSHSDRHLSRLADHDIWHIRECHVDVRLREAEDAADNFDLETALRKIESAIGYLVILHARTRDKKTSTANTGIGIFTWKQEKMERLIDKGTILIQDDLTLKKE